MFWGILNAFITSFSDIFWKKALTLSNVSERVFYVIGTSWAILISIFLIATGIAAFPENPWFLAIPFFDAFAVQYTGTLSQKIYQEEKLSVLMPYKNLASVMTVVAAFFLFGNTSVTTLCIAIGIIGLIAFRSFDRKNFSFPRKIVPVFTLHTANAIRQLSMAYVLMHILSTTFYSVRNLAGLLVFLGMSFVLREKLSISGMDPRFLRVRLTGAAFYAAASFFGFALIKDLGIVTTTLLGFVTMASTFVLQWLVLREKPDSNDVAFSFFIAALSGIGMYLR